MIYLFLFIYFSLKFLGNFHAEKLTKSYFSGFINFLGKTREHFTGICLMSLPLNITLILGSHLDIVLKV